MVIKVLIVGDSPYPKPEDRHWLAFSSSKARKTPGSLRNIFKELRSCYPGIELNSNDLTPWYEQGVLLINACDIKLIPNDVPVNVILALGKRAQKLVEHIDNPNVLVLLAGHPSPNNTSGSFLGGQWFKLCNNWLRDHGQVEIDWELK